MADEISPAEMGRMLARIELQLGRLVGSDLYTANRLADQERMARIEVDLRAERAEREKSDERRNADRRLVFAALIAPLVIVLIQLYLAGRGAGT